MAVTITVGTNSWVTEAEANAYLAARLRASDTWTDGATDNAAALVTAYRWLMASGQYSLSASASASDAVKNAQCEYALWLLQQQPALDARMGLQVQHVVEAGVVKEKYSKPDGNIPIPTVVDRMLNNYRTQKQAYVFDVERNEEQETDYNAPGNLTRNT